MRKIKSFVLAVIGLLCSISVSAHDFEVDGIYYNITSSADMTVEVTYRGKYYDSYSNEYSGAVNIPESVTYNGRHTFSVTRIGSSAFYNCSGLTSVVIPNSVTSIGSSAFYNCDGLTSVVIPNSVTSIGSYAFYDCDSLTSVVIGNSVTSIGDDAFYSCNNLKFVLNNSNFTFKKGSSSYGYIAYYAIVVCNGFVQVGDFYFTEEDNTCYLRAYLGNETELVLPANYKGRNYGIGAYVFSSCSGLKSLTIGTGVLSIGSNQCSPTKTIWLTNTPPSGWENLEGTINYVANEQYGSLSNVKVYPYLSSMFETDGVKYVPVSPSERTCDAIDCNYDSVVEEISIGETVSYKGVAMTVKNVMPYAAYGYKIVKQLSLSHKGEVGASAFYGCTGITTLTLGDGITSIGESAFRECSSLSEVKIPKKVIELGNYCFANTALESISIPASVTRIGSYAFDDCTKMTDVVIEDRTAELSLGSNGSSPLFADCPLDSVYIGGNITYNTSSSYGYSPFYRNTSLRSVVIMDKEEEISDNEFYGCTNLKNVTIGSNVKKIGNWAFSGCSNLDYFSFGKSVETIGQEAFSDCVNLTKLISYAEVPPTCGTMALDDINKWNCVLQVPKSCLAAYQQADQWKEFFFIEDVLTAIGGVTVDGAVSATADVYSTNGMLIKRNAELKNLKHELPAGIYIIGGKKVWVR